MFFFIVIVFKIVLSLNYNPEDYLLSPEWSEYAMEDIARIKLLDSQKKKRRKAEYTYPSSYNFYEDYPFCERLALNQGSCGSCWLIATMQALEGRFCKLHVDNGLNFNHIDLGAQEYLDCKYASGCSGGWFSPLVSYLVADGIVDDDCDPYVAMDPTNGRTCPNSCANHLDWNTDKYQFDSYGSTTNMDDIKQEIYDNGPVMTALEWVGTIIPNQQTNEDRKQLYTCVPNSGVVNHAVILVGWDSDNGQDYWIMKNSWGHNWGYGMNGIGDKGGLLNWVVGTCSIGSVGYWADPSPCSDGCDYCGYFPSICSNAGTCSGLECECDQQGFDDACLDCAANTIPEDVCTSCINGYGPYPDCSGCDTGVVPPPPEGYTGDPSIYCTMCNEEWFKGDDYPDCDTCIRKNVGPRGKCDRCINGYIGHPNCTIKGSNSIAGQVGTILLSIFLTLVGLLCTLSLIVVGLFFLKRHMTKSAETYRKSFSMKGSNNFKKVRQSFRQSKRANIPIKKPNRLFPPRPPLKKLPPKKRLPPRKSPGRSIQNRAVPYSRSTSKPSYGKPRRPMSPKRNNRPPAPRSKPPARSFGRNRPMSPKRRPAPPSSKAGRPKQSRNKFRK